MQTILTVKLIITLIAILRVDFLFTITEPEIQLTDQENLLFISILNSPHYPYVETLFMVCYICKPDLEFDLESD